MPAERTMAIVIATHDRPESLSACLQSVVGQTVPPNDTVVVIDGGQVAAAVRVVEQFARQGTLKVRAIVNPERRGATASKNRGADAITADIVAFVDDDITLAPKWIAEILRAYRDNAGAVGVGGQVVMRQRLFNHPLYDLAVAVRWRFFRSRLGRMNFVGIPYLSHTLPSTGYLRTEFLHGGCMTVVRDAFRTTKFDESMGVRDEFDLCVRLRKQWGDRLIYAPHAVGYHNRVSTGGFGAWGHDRLMLDIRDHVPFLIKNFTWPYVRLVGYAGLVLIYAAVALRPRYLSALWSGWVRHREGQRGHPAGPAARSSRALGN